MQSFSYYSYEDETVGLNRCSKESSDSPLIVNCSGCYSTSFPFTTDNKSGRLDYYLIYIESGELTFFDGDTSLMARDGSIIILPSKKGYKYIYSGGNELKYLWIHFTGKDAEKRLAEYSLDSFPKIHRASDANHIPQRFQDIFDAFEKHDALRDNELSALLDRLLIATSRSIYSHEARICSLSKSIKYIISNYNADIKIPELASMEHLSTSRYNFLFKEQLGVSPKKYILKLRMSMASELLVCTDLPINQVGITCGYDDPHFFSKVFKAFFGVSPAAYKKGERIISPS